MPGKAYITHPAFCCLTGSSHILLLFLAVGSEYAELVRLWDSRSAGDLGQLAGPPLWNPQALELNML